MIQAELTFVTLDDKYEAAGKLVSLLRFERIAGADYLSLTLTVTPFASPPPSFRLTTADTQTLVNKISASLGGDATLQSLQLGTWDPAGKPAGNVIITSQYTTQTAPMTAAAVIFTFNHHSSGAVRFLLSRTTPNPDADMLPISMAYVSNGENDARILNGLINFTATTNSPFPDHKKGPV